MHRRRWVLGLLLVGLAATLSACGGSFRLPGGQRLSQQRGAALLERKSGQIVYVGVDGNIYVTDQSGATQTRLTTDANQTEDFFLLYLWPTWSRDSSQIAFIGQSARQADSFELASVLYTVSPEGGVLTEAYTSDEKLLYYLNWSPDGRYVSFLSQDPNTRFAELEAVFADGSSRDAVQLGRGATLYHSWAPEGNSVLVHTDGQPDGELEAVDLGTNPTSDLQIQPLPFSPGTFQTPAWSPDGTKILFATSGESDSDALVVADRDGQNPRVIAEFSRRIAFAWSPDSRKIAYLTSDSPLQFGGAAQLNLAGELHVYDLLRNEHISFEDEQEPVVAFFWSPDSKRLAYFAPRTVTVPSEETETEQEARLMGLNVAVAQSGETFDLFQFPPPQDFLQVLSFFDQFAQSTTIWSPDSQYLVFPVLQQESSVIAVMHVSGSIDPRAIAEGTVAFWSWE